MSPTQSIRESHHYRHEQAIIMDHVTTAEFSGHISNGLPFTSRNSHNRRQAAGWRWSLVSGSRYCYKNNTGYDIIENTSSRYRRHNNIYH